MQMMSLGLRAKILGSFCAIALIGGAIGYAGWTSTKDLTLQLNSLGDNSIPSLIALANIRFWTTQIKASMRTFASSAVSSEMIKDEFEIIRKGRSIRQEALDTYASLPMTDEERLLFTDFTQKLDLSRQEADVVIAEAETLLDAEMSGAERSRVVGRIAESVLNGDNRRRFDDAMDALQRLMSYAVEHYGGELIDDANRTAGFFALAIAVASFGGLALSILLGLVVATSISRPMIRNTSEIGASSDQLEGASRQIALSSQDLSSGANSLASSVEEISSSMEELQSTIEANSKNINESELLMRGTAESAEALEARSGELMSMMNAINENSRKIVRINKVVDDIAFQTSILALNAAVEAARAGEAGRGFAVVAEQVKTLAQKSAEASKETSELIDSVVSNIEKGAERTRTVSDESRQVNEAAAKVKVLLDEVNRASKEQSKGASQVTKAMLQVNAVVQQTASSSEETAASAEELLSQAEQLRGAVRELRGIVLGGRRAERETAAGGAGILDLKQRQPADRPAARPGVPGPQDPARSKTALTVVDASPGAAGEPETVLPLNDFKDF